MSESAGLKSLEMKHRPIRPGRCGLTSRTTGRRNHEANGTNKMNGPEEGCMATPAVVRGRTQVKAEQDRKLEALVRAAERSLRNE
jgi:hypothetical protein